MRDFIAIPLYKGKIKMKIQRRVFLKVGLATAGALAARSAWGNVGPDEVQEPQWEGVPGEEKEVYSVCQMCPNGCGIKVRVYEGRVIKVEGHPGHPLNKGALCPRGQAAPRLLYHPDRLTYPLVNKGSKKQANWQKLTYEEALDVLAGKLHDLTGNRSNHHLVAASGSFSDLDDFILERFCNSFGTPNYLKFESLGRRAMSMAMGLTHGSYSPPSVDWDKCDYLMLFGAEPGATDNSPMPMMNGFGKMRQGRAGRRTKIVHIGTRYTPFSSKVDEWVKVNPGTYGALALGIAHVIISEERFDTEFIDRFSLGFRDMTEIDGTTKPGFKEHVLRNYSPEAVSSITGVPNETIIRLAEEFADGKPAVAYGGDGPASYSNAVTELVAIHCLNALVGSIDVPGGIIIQQSPSLKKEKSSPTDALFAYNLKQPRVDGLRQSSDLPVFSTMSGLPSRLVEAVPYPIDVLMLVDLDPVANLPGSANWQKALEKIPFVVSFSNHLDESSKLADMIIPNGTFLERWDGKSVDSSTGFPVWGLGRPVIESPEGQIDTSSLVLKLANKMGDKMGSFFPWGSTKDLLREMSSGLQASAGEDELWNELDSQGFWSAGPYSFGQQKEVYKARGSRFNFYMYLMEAASADLYEGGFRSQGSTSGRLTQSDFLPNHISPEFSEAGVDYPFHLELFGTTVSGHGRWSLLDGLQEILELGLNRSWRRLLLINDYTAEQYDFANDMPVWVESSSGKILAYVKKSKVMDRSCVGMIFGQGRPNHNADPRANQTPFSLLGEQISPIGGGYCWGGTKVKVYKA